MRLRSLKHYLENIVEPLTAYPSTDSGRAVNLQQAQGELLTFEVKSNIKHLHQFLQLR